MPAIDISFDISEDEFVEGSLARYRKAKAIAPRTWAPILLVPILVVVMLAYNHDLATPWGAMTLGAAFCLVLVVPLAAKAELKWRIRSADRALRAKYEVLQCKRQRYVFDDESWQNTCTCGTDARFWPAVRAIEEFPTILILKMRNGSGYILPKRVFTAEQMTAFRDLLQRRVTSRAS